MEYNIEDIKKNLKIKYLNNLLNILDQKSINYDIIKKEINKLDYLENDYYSITEKNIDSEKKNNSEKIDYLYLKPWSKLTLIHKIIKIKEFINNLQMDNNSKDKLKDELVDIIKNKKIKNKINYDESIGKILSIPILSFENNNYNIKY
jgi:hypothetical protein